MDGHHGAPQARQALRDHLQVVTAGAGWFAGPHSGGRWMANQIQSFRRRAPVHLPLLEAVLMSCGAQLAERSPSSSRHPWVSAACPAVHTGSGTQPDTHQESVLQAWPTPPRSPPAPPVPVLHPRLRADGVLQGQPMHVQELLQLLQLRGPARLPCPAAQRGADFGHHTGLFAFQKRFARLLQTRLVWGDVGAGGLVQMHGPRGSLAPQPLGGGFSEPPL